jgi:hypothetical protein
LKYLLSNAASCSKGVVTSLEAIRFQNDSTYLPVVSFCTCDLLNSQQKNQVLPQEKSLRIPKNIL